LGGAGIPCFSTRLKVFTGETGNTTKGREGTDTERRKGLVVSNILVLLKLGGLAMGEGKGKGSSH